MCYLSPPPGARGEESGLYDKNSIPNKNSFPKNLAVGTVAFKSVLYVCGEGNSQKCGVLALRRK